jgi:dTDP-4-dehydrorhamnose 3,5-epimerase
MQLRSTPLADAKLIDVEPESDERGFFARLYSRESFANWGLPVDFAQTSISYNEDRGTLRGLHFQKPPHEERKLVWCVKGAIFDVMVDLRPSSPTFERWYAVELTEQPITLAYIPAGFAHGFETLEPDTVVHYQISVSYNAGSASGIYWDDETLAIPWPIRPPVRISGRDRRLPSLREPHR